MAYYELDDMSGVEYVTPNSISHAVGAPLIAEQNTQGAASERMDKLESWGTEYIGAVEMADYLEEQGKLPDEDFLVAVIDSGVYPAHPFLEGRIATEKGRNFSAASSDPNDYIDVHGHGTHVSGTIVDCTPDEVKIIPVKARDNGGAGDNFSIGQAMLYAAEAGAKVINMSLRGIVPNIHTDPIGIAAKQVTEQGVLVVAASGNDYGSVDRVVPGGVFECLTVSAMNYVPALDNKSGQVSVADFSNYGGTVDVAAPGKSIYSCLPNGYTIMEGTSMAAPHVTAAVSMIAMDIGDDVTPVDLEWAVINTSTPWPGDTFTWNAPVPSYGYGILDLRRYVGLQTGEIHEADAESISLDISNMDMWLLDKCPVWVENGGYTKSTAPRVSFYDDGGLGVTDKSVTYQSLNPDVASVDKYGVINAVNVGNATIEVALKNKPSVTAYFRACVQYRLSKVCI
jgi:subtilisin family serine protease